jgi:hypothetical protein
MNTFRTPKNPSFDLQIWLLEQELIKTREQVNELAAIVFRALNS